MHKYIYISIFFKVGTFTQTYIYIYIHIFIYLYIFEVHHLNITDPADLYMFSMAPTRVSLEDVLKDITQPPTFTHMRLDLENVEASLPAPGWPESTYRDQITKGFYGAHYDFADGEYVHDDWSGYAHALVTDIKEAASLPSNDAPQ